MEKVIIFSAPSGSGKTTIVRQLLQKYPQFEFSVSATSRAPRGQEVDGVDYYFLTEEEFLRRIEADAFVEWEAVYAGTHYGTLRSEIDRIWAKGNIIIFDVDVVEQFLSYAVVAALLVVWGDGVELVEAHYGHLLEAHLSRLVSVYEFAIESQGSLSCGESQ